MASRGLNHGRVTHFAEKNRPLLDPISCARDCAEAQLSAIMHDCHQDSIEL